MGRRDARVGQQGVGDGVRVDDVPAVGHVDAKAVKVEHEANSVKISGHSVPVSLDIGSLCARP